MRFPAPTCTGLLAALFACSEAESPVAVSAPQFAESATISEVTPISALIVNDCTGEEVLVTGEIHSKFHLTVQPDGSFNSETTVNTQNTQAQALVTGARYVAKQEFSQTFQDIPPGTTVTLETDFHLIRSGESGLLPNDDLMVHELIHFTVNAKGTMTVNNFDSRIECR